MFQGTIIGDKLFSLMLFSEFLDLRAVSRFWQLWSLHGTAGDMVKVKGGNLGGMVAVARLCTKPRKAEMGCQL